MLTGPAIDSRTQYARLILDVYDRIGTDVFVPGVRDFAAGLDFLLREASRRDMAFVVANLVDSESGRPLFDRYVILERGGVKVGVAAVVTGQFERERRGRREAGVTVLNPIEEAEAVVRDLRDEVDVLILVAALKREEMELIRQRVTGPDVVFLAHDRRAFSNRRIRGSGRPMLAAYTKGRNVGDLTLFLRERGEPFFDVSRRRDLEQRIERLQNNLETRRAAAERATGEEVRERHRRMIQRMESLLAEKQQELSGLSEGPNTYRYELVSLNRRIVGDPEIERLILAVKARIRGPDAVRSRRAGRTREREADAPPTGAEGLVRPLRLLRPGEGREDPETRPAAESPAGDEEAE